MSKTMKLSGAETLSASANIFVGQTEAPLLIKPFIARMTRSELLAIMVGGMATIAGAVMIVYITLLGGSDPAEQVRWATHLLTASVLSAPAALIVAKILLPQKRRSTRRFK
jgi:CNT family concentrative nucleoside transporter